MGIMASVNCYTTRVNLSVTIVEMVNETWLAEHSVNQTVLSPCGNSTPTPKQPSSESHLFEVCQPYLFSKHNKRSK